MRVLTTVLCSALLAVPAAARAQEPAAGAPTAAAAPEAAAAAPTTGAVDIGAPGPVSLHTVSAGTTSTCAISTDQDGYCWGMNAGQLGIGGTPNGSAQTVPAPVIGGLKFQQLIAGSNDACGVTARTAPLMRRSRLYAEGT